uniref:HHO5-like N-terminal domain-containing protein n=1 Tax=Zoysia matrella TaxID=38722 RepID=A0A0C4MLG7_9POAL|nr:hypothetical protein [Zoysia matrella]
MGLDVGEIGMGADLSLDLRHFAARAMRQSKNAPPASDMDAYIRRLEEERGKIEVFRRELPICARLLADVIDVMKEEAEKKKRNDRKEDEAGDKSKWMSTAQLWTGGSGSDAAETEKQDKGTSSSSSEPKSCGGAFTPFKAVGSGAPAFGRPCLRNDDKAAGVGTPPDLSPLSPPAVKSVPAGAADKSNCQVLGFAQAAARAAAMVPSGPALSGLQRQPQQTTPPPQQQQQQQARKSRRCWSPELHRQFVAALNQLGGPQVATPKQIRELMKVTA